jgi:hypothetical protein
MTLNLDPTTTILIGLILWCAMFPLIFIIRRALKLPSVGLDLAYLLVFFIGHAPGAFLYVLPWYFTVYDGFAVAQGFELSWLGVLAFSIALIFGLLLFQNRHTSIRPASPSIELNNPQLPWLLFGMGLVTYLIVLPIADQIPSVTSIVINLTNLQVVGIVVGMWQGITQKQPRKLLLWIAMSPLLPFLTITTGGFLGYGVVSMTVIALFLLSRIRLQWWHIPVALVIVYFGLSLYITYIEGRGEIRAVVWGESAYEERFDVVGNEFSQWEWFDWQNRSHLSRVDDRLNQNFLVGVARINLENGVVRYGDGETIQRAFIAFIPRIIWPDKPVVAGGTEIVTKYTLIEFLGTTSVAAGQVMEFYVNFGTSGVIIGFASLGLLFAWVDSRSAYRLDTGNLYGFLRWYLVGMALLKPTDDLTVMTAGAASALVTSILLEQGLKWWFARQSKPQSLSGVRPAPMLVPPRR